MARTHTHMRCLFWYQKLWINKSYAYFNVFSDSVKKHMLFSLSTTSRSFCTPFSSIWDEWRRKKRWSHFHKSQAASQPLEMKSNSKETKQNSTFKEENKKTLQPPAQFNLAFYFILDLEWTSWFELWSIYIEWASIYKWRIFSFIFGCKINFGSWLIQ